VWGAKISVLPAYRRFLGCAPSFGTPHIPAHLDWATFASRSGLYLWEAFHTGAAKARTHVDDATVAFDAFRAALPNPPAANNISAGMPQSTPQFSGAASVTISSFCVLPA